MKLIDVQPPERVNDLLNLADIHLLPQIAGAADLVMPSKLTGMMASGRAILATADPGTQLFKVLEDTGMVAPPEDTNAFVSSLLQLADDASLRKRLGQAARRYAVARLGRETILEQFEKSVLSLCGVPSMGAKARSLASSRRKLAVEERAATGNAGED